VLRSLKWATVDVERSLAMSTSGPDAMHRALTSVIMLADWFSEVILEPSAPYLSLEQQELLTTATDEYVALWQECAKAARGDLTPSEQRIMLAICAGVANELAVRATEGSERPSDAAVARIALDVLLGI
jgi:hypothetical protein